MKVVPSEKPMEPAEVKRHSGKTWEEWYAHLDKEGGVARGRRAITEALMEVHRLEPWWAQTIAVEYEAARQLREKDGRPKGYSICVTKTIAAPAESIFDAFTTSAGLNAWLGEDSSLTSSEGGRWSTGDGNRGVFTKILRPKTLRFTWEDDVPELASTVELKLAPKGDKCSLVLNHERIQTRALADGLRTAWGAAIERLKRHLEA
jgi:uncharacterized protein YndB with AHSA1/START domain